MKHFCPTGPDKENTLFAFLLFVFFLQNGRVVCYLFRWGREGFFVGFPEASFVRLNKPLSEYPTGCLFRCQFRVVMKIGVEFLLGRKGEIHLPKKPYFHKGQDDFFLVVHGQLGWGRLLPGTGDPEIMPVF